MSNNTQTWTTIGELSLQLGGKIFASMTLAAHGHGPQDRANTAQMCFKCKFLGPKATDATYVEDHDGIAGPGTQNAANHSRCLAKRAINGVVIPTSAHKSHRACLQAPPAQSLSNAEQTLLATCSCQTAASELVSGGCTFKLGGASPQDAGNLERCLGKQCTASARASFVFKSVAMVCADGSQPQNATNLVRVCGSAMRVQEPMACTSVLW